MAKLTRKAYNHFDTTNFGWVYDDEFEPELNELCDKLQNTLYRIKFAYQCLYPNERPLSKKDYARTRYTERVIDNKLHNLWQCNTKSQDEAFQRGHRMMMLQKGCYPFGIDVEAEIENGNEEFCKFYYEGRYKTGSFIDKFVAHIHRF